MGELGPVDKATTIYTAKQEDNSNISQTPG